MTKDIKVIREEFDKLKAALAAATPFISSLLRKVRVILTKRIDTAAIDRNSVIYINVDFWDGLNYQQKAWVLSHEIWHVAFRDHRRLGSRNPEKFNIATDGVNNTIMSSCIRQPREMEQFGVDLNKLYYQYSSEFRAKGVSQQDLEKMSKEEVYKIIPEQPGGGYKVIVAGDLKGAGNCGGGDGDTVINEGNPDMYDENGDPDEKWKDALSDAYVAEKSAGSVPAGLKRLVDGLLKPQVDWRTILRQRMRAGLGRTIVSSWHRPSRKHSMFPGTRRFTIPKVILLMDTSGSVGGKEIEAVMTECYEIAKDSPVKVICWDGKAYDPVEAKNPREVITKVMQNIKGGGGTMIGPALKSCLQEMKSSDVVVVFTDGYIFDLDDSNVTDLLKSIRAKAAAQIWCTTAKKNDIPGWTEIEITINDGR